MVDIGVVFPQSRKAKDSQKLAERPGADVSKHPGASEPMDT